MIKGHGIDIESIAAIEKAYQKNTRFAEKVLTEAERERFEELSGKTENGIFNGPDGPPKKPFQRQWEQGLDQLVFKI